MSNNSPIGLTRAEEEALYKPEPRIIVKAPSGATTCNVRLPGGGECPAAATHRIVWPSGDGWDKPTSACVDCASRMKQIAELEHKYILRVEPIE